MKLVEFEIASNSYSVKTIYINPKQVIAVSELVEYDMDVVTLIEVAHNAYRIKEPVKQVIEKLISE